MTHSQIWTAILKERARQEKKFPGRTIADVPPLMKLRILVEEVGEVAEAMDTLDANTVRNLKDELIQVAAVAVGWLESVDKRKVNGYAKVSG